MRFLLPAFVSLLFLLPRVVAEDPLLVAPTEALAPEQEKAKFRLPPGFEAQLVAAEPDIAKPMNLAFDAKGRLWVTSSVEYPFPAKEGKGRDTLKVLSDFGPDGRARRIETFADGLNIPIGVLPLSDRVLVHSIPNIWELRDTDGDGKADVRKEFITGVGFRDTHGMTSSFTYSIDGWVYACHGFANDSTLKGRDGAALKLNSGNTYRFKPDGTKLEQFTYGQVNPFGLAFDKWGNLFSADCHSKPITLLLRGGCYSSFGKPHDGLGFVPDICNDDHGGTGLCGLCCLETDTVPPAFRGNLLVGNVVMSKINRDSIVWDGDVKATKLEADFLKSDDPWFRPVDLKLGPDGALYVADFYNCIIGHYEVDLRHPRRDRTRGRIWRIVYTGKDAKQCRSPNQDWTKTSTSGLVESLYCENLARRTLATQLLVERGGEETTRRCREVLTKAYAPAAQAHAAWVLERLGAASDTEIGDLLGGSELAKVHALRLLAERPGNSGPWVAGLAMEPSPQVRRLACGLLRNAEHPFHAGDLLAAGAGPAAAPLTRHTLKIALRDRLASEWYPLEETADAALRGLLLETALGVRSRNAGDYLLAMLAKDAVPGPLAPQAFRHVGRSGAVANIEAVARKLEKISDGESFLGAVTALKQGCQDRGADLPAEVVRIANARAAAHLSKAGVERRLGIRCAEALQLVELAPRLAAIAADDEDSLSDRVFAAYALAKLKPDDAVPHVVALWRRDPSREERLRLIQSLSGIPTAPGRTAMADLLVAAPADLQLPLAVALASSKDGAEALLAAIEAGKASPRLLQDQGLTDRVRQANPREHGSRLAKLTAGLQPPDVRLAQLLGERRARFSKAQPDLEKGKLVFEKTCAACHQLGGKGGKVGPQLDGIGVRGVDRLLEDLLDPNRNVDQAFRATLLELDDGKLLTGLLLREEGETLVLADDKGQEVRVPKKKVEQRKTTANSPMPGNLLDQIPSDDFDHLLGYLLSQKAKP